MPPPSTPSPRRFLSSSKPKSSARQPLPPSSLRHQSTATASSQFAPTPRFTTPHTTKRAEDDQVASSSPLVSRTRHPVASRQARDDIEDYAEAEAKAETEQPFENADDEMLLDSLEFDLPPPKRRRTTPPPVELNKDVPKQNNRHHDPIVISSSPHPDYHSSPSESPPGSQSPTPQTPHPLDGHDVKHGTPAATVSSASTTSRPKFILPTSDDEAPEETLPPIFSPRRRGQRFVPGGMASTVRDWVLELETGGGPAHTFSQRLGLRRKTDTVKVRVASLAEGRDGRCVVVESTAGDRWMLVGDYEPGVGVGRGLRAGDAVALRMPIWEVRLEGREVGVAVNWSVADPG